MRQLPTLLAGILTVLSGHVIAQESRLAYAIKIDPGASQVHVTGTVAGHAPDEVKNFASFGRLKNVQIGVQKEGKLVKFSYRTPIPQKAYGDPFQPVLAENYFSGFLSTVLVAPQIKGVAFKDIPLNLEVPEGWKIATSLGVGASNYTAANLHDLAGMLVCAGDFATHSFELAHRGSDVVTKCYVAVRGERDWDDDEFYAELKRLMRGQMDYFGGTHPAPIQFLALHLLPKGSQPSIPAFNRRSPGHDTVLALHTPARPRQHFEFLGMLAHEHLHNWYPNAMRSDLGPWFMEGLNDYVAYRGLLANGLHSREQFSRMLSKWHREYEMCVRTNNQRLMPYRRGMVAAWVLDIELRRATGGEHGLTDVLLRLIQEKPEGGIVQRQHLLAMLKKISGKDMEPLYQHLVEDEGAIDLAKYLEGSGFRIVEKTRAIEIAPETEAEKTLFEAILSE